MENTPHNAVVRLDDHSAPMTPAPVLDTPHFDEQAIQSAQPAVPLARIRARRFWRLMLVFTCSAILLGSALAIALSSYQNRSNQISTSATSIAPEKMSQSKSQEPLSQSAVKPEEKANDAAPAVPVENAPATRDAGARKSREVVSESMTGAQDSDSRATLHGALGDWIAATNDRDIQRQMDFYSPTVNAFYLQRNVTREAVRAEKSRVFSRADLVDMQTAVPGIRLSRDGRSATMRFRKKYAIQGGGEDRRGEVVQELRWQRTADGWKIVSERDLRVIH